ncbi:ABC transporter ATP-binding protein [Salana multivorans]
MVASSVLAVLDLAALAFVAAAIPSFLPGGEGRARLPILGELAVSPVGLLVGVVVVIILKSVLGVLLQWILTRRLAGYELAVADQLLAAYLRAPWERRSTYNSAVLVRVADTGIANAIAGVLVPYSQIPAELATFVAVLIGVTVLDPVLALVTLVYLGLMAFALMRWMSRRAVVAGRVTRDYHFRTASLITEAVAALKELTLRGRIPEVLSRVHELRSHSARARANISFLSTAPRFVLEGGLVVGFGVVALTSYLVAGGQATGAVHAATAVGLFAMAGFRLVPSITRMQAISTQINSNLAHAQRVIEDIRGAGQVNSSAELLSGVLEVHGSGDLTSGGFHGDIRFDGVSYSYPDGPPAVRDLTFTIPAGTSCALVGSSGSGKSTTVDLLLGLLAPGSGRISVDGEPLARKVSQWQTQVAYVPQEVILLDATIGQNVALTWDDNYDRARAERAIERAQALDLVRERADGLDARVGERGIALSGGQRQRIGIARALYSEPVVLVLDEATSALDAETEARVAAAIAALAGQVTVVTVAHRLATIRDFDQVIVLEGGHLVGAGTFDELVRTVPSLATQAAHAGLAAREGQPEP